MGSDIGLIAISTFANRGVVPAFDRALEALRTTRGLIVDVRSNAGGDTAIARPIIGRLITARRRSRVDDKPRWTRSRPASSEFVDARDPWTYSAPVVVVVDRFSVSMAEGFAMALSDSDVRASWAREWPGLGSGRPNRASVFQGRDPDHHGAGLCH